MDNMPLVSILIPVYQRYELAVEAIDSALKQDYPNCEIIVGDNCSQDNTFQRLLEHYKDNEGIVLFQNKTNLGAVGNWEQCLKRANGKYVKFLWSDDLMSETFVSDSVKILEANSDVSFVFSSVYIFCDIEELNRKIARNEKAEYRFRNKTGIYSGSAFLKSTFDYNYSVPVSPGCAIFRKEKIKLVDYIPNKFNYIHRRNGAGPDLLMYLETISNNEEVGFISTPSNFFRLHESSITVSDNTVLDGYWTAKQDYLKRHKIEKYWRSLNIDIISTINKRNVLSYNYNKSTLQRFYDVSDPHIKQHSVIEVILFKIQKRFTRRH